MCARRANRPESYTRNVEAEAQRGNKVAEFMDKHRGAKRQAQRTSNLRRTSVQVKDIFKPGRPGNLRKSANEERRDEQREKETLLRNRLDWLFAYSRGLRCKATRASHACSMRPKVGSGTVRQVPFELPAVRSIAAAIQS